MCFFHRCLSFWLIFSEIYGCDFYIKKSLLRKTVGSMFSYHLIIYREIKKLLIGNFFCN